MIGININETDVQVPEDHAASASDRLVNHPGSIGEMTAIPPAERTGKLDILDGVTVGIAKREF